MGVSSRPSSIGHVMLARAVGSAVLSLDTLSRSVAIDLCLHLYVGDAMPNGGRKGSGYTRIDFRLFCLLPFLPLVIPSFPLSSTPNRP